MFSAIFLLPVWPETAVGGLFLSVMRVLHCVVASRQAQSAAGRRPTTRILLPVQQEVNVRRRWSPEVLFCHQEAFGIQIVDLRVQTAVICVFRQTMKWLYLDRK